MFIPWLLRLVAFWLLHIGEGAQAATYQHSKYNAMLTQVATSDVATIEALLPMLQHGCLDREPAVSSSNCLQLVSSSVM